VELELPPGRQARQAWRALSVPARKDAFAAASRGVAPSDVGIAWAAAGYGRTVARRLRVASLLTPVALAVVGLPIGAALAVARASAGTVDVVMALLLVVTLGGFAALRVRAARYQRLHASGLLGLEAARLGSLAPTPAQSVWGSGTAESGFTVPYHAQIPVPAPLPRTAPDPTGTGVREVPLRRGRVLVGLAMLLAIALVFWTLVVVIWHGSRPPILTTLITVLAVVYTLMLPIILYATAPALRRPVAARFTPDGWELPQQRMSGPWADVRAIRVRPLSSGGLAAGSPQLAGVRVVTLIVDDPERHIAQLSPMRRALIRGSIKKYGSPIVIVAMPGRTMPVVELVQLLQRYTSAPVEWDTVGATATVS
jgi:hypothetical protein